MSPKSGLLRAGGMILPQSWQEKTHLGASSESRPEPQRKRRKKIPRKSQLAWEGCCKAEFCECRWGYRQNM